MHKKSACRQDDSGDDAASTHVRAYGWRGCRKAPDQSVSQTHAWHYGDLGARVIPLTGFSRWSLVLLCVPSIRVGTEIVKWEERKSSFPQAFRLCEYFMTRPIKNKCGPYKERLHAFSPGNARRVRGLQATVHLTRSRATVKYYERKNMGGRRRDVLWFGTRPTRGTPRQDKACVLL